jgi:hypothetical protein
MSESGIWRWGDSSSGMGEMNTCGRPRLTRGNSPSGDVDMGSLLQRDAWAKDQHFGLACHVDRRGCY